MSKLFIRSLNWNTDHESLRNCFEEFGEVTEAVVVKDRETGRSRGFGFVTFANEDDAIKAMEAMDNQEFEGRRIAVVVAEARGGGGGGGGGGGYRRGGGGGGYNRGDNNGAWR